MAKKDEKMVETATEKTVKETKKTAKTADNAIAKMNIYEKMAAISNEVGTISKDMLVGMPGRQYKAVSETAVLATVKKLEDKYRVYSYPATRSQDVITELVGKVTMRVSTVYRFVNLDKPTEVLEMTSYGDGVDTLDKAPGKAMTYADKYALMKAYKIATGDDPDQEASPEDNTKSVKTEPTKPISKEQITEIRSMINAEREKGMLKAYKVDAIEKLTDAQGKSIIKKLTAEAKRNKEKLETETVADTETSTATKEVEAEKTAEK